MSLLNSDDKVNLLHLHITTNTIAEVVCPIYYHKKITSLIKHLEPEREKDARM